MSLEQPVFDKEQSWGESRQGKPEDLELPSERAERKATYERIRQEIERTADLLGQPIDQGIKETVIVFNAFGLNTVASCEGHLDHGTSAPWIEIGAIDKPQERFIGEDEIFQAVADKHGISLDEAKRDLRPETHEDYLRALREAGEKGETVAYKEWRGKTRALRRKAEDLLREFYENKKFSPNVRLTISQGGEGEFRLRNGGRDYRPAPENLTDKQKEKLSRRLERYRREMDEFAEFLKRKFLGETDSTS